MVLIDIKKYIVVSLLLMSTTTVVLPSAAVPSAQVQEVCVATRYEDEMVEFDMIDANEKINPQKLINGWAAFLARASKYLFIVGNKVYIWWYGSARRNMVRG